MKGERDQDIDGPRDIGIAPKGPKDRIIVLLRKVLTLHLLCLHLSKVLPS